MVLGDAVSKLETFVWILNQISRSITSSHFIDWLKFETRPSSLLNFGTAYKVFMAYMSLFEGPF